jgi:hypothetical protein
LVFLSFIHRFAISALTYWRVPDCRRAKFHIGLSREMTSYNFTASASFRQMTHQHFHDCIGCVTAGWEAIAISFHGISASIFIGLFRRIFTSFSKIVRPNSRLHWVFSTKALYWRYHW